MGLPNEVNSALIGAAAAGGYEIGQSLRWANDSNMYLSQSINSAPTSSTLATISFWYKATQQDNGYLFFDCRNGSVDWGFTGGIKFNSGFAWGDATFGSAANATGVTNYWTLNQYPSEPAVRDPSAWYHVVLQWDSGNGTSTKRQRIWLNGSEYDFYNYYGSIGSNEACYWTRNGYTLKVGGSSNSEYMMAEVHCIDGQRLDPDNFYEYNNDGIYVPKKYTGTYGNNGFYLTFDSGAANGIGHDHSGQGNHFTANGFSTSGNDNDVLDDTPTNNGITWQPIYGKGASLNKANFSNANRTVSPAVGSQNCQITYTTCAVPYSQGGVYYAEFIVEDHVNYNFGVTALSDPDLPMGEYGAFWGCYAYSGGSAMQADNGATFSVQEQHSAASTGNRIAVKWSFDDNEVSIWVNGTRTGFANNCNFSNYDYFTPFCKESTRTAGASVFRIPASYSYGPSSSRHWRHVKDVLDAPNIKDGTKYFDTKLYTGNSTGGAATQTLTGLAFSPDWVWIKSRFSASSNHVLADTVRGANSTLFSNGTSQEVSNYSRGYLSAFTSDGFTVTTGSTDGRDANGLSSGSPPDQYRAWCWDAASSNSSNTDGGTSSTVRANTTSGFSVITYSGGGSATTVGHGLGSAPKWLIVKNRSSATAYNWYVWHQGLSSASYFVNLNRNVSQIFSGDPFNGTAPTSSVFSVGGENVVNGVNYVAYAFSEVEGFSKFGSYVGNANTDGPLIWLGFKPAWIVFKARDNADHWFIYDSASDPYNVTYRGLVGDDTDAEKTNQSNIPIDILSNGFKIKFSGTAGNGDGNTYIYAAFAQKPYGGGTASPVTAT